MKLFEYVVLHREKERKDKDGNTVPERLTILQDVTTVAAKDEKVVILNAARNIPTQFTDRLDEVEIAVRPF